MAGNLHGGNLDDDLIARLKRRAARHGRSTEAVSSIFVKFDKIRSILPFWRQLVARASFRVSSAT
jgi:hypothetical protein